MKAATVQTVAKLARVERTANRDAIERAARANPGHVAKALSADPTLLNAYAEANVIIDVLYSAGQTQALEAMKDSRSCSQRVRRLIVDKLLFG